jgi:hypothetical protein
VKVIRPKLSREEKARRARRARAIAALGAETIEDADRLRAVKKTQQRAARLAAKNRRFKLQDEKDRLTLYSGLAGVVLWHARKALSKAG